MLISTIKIRQVKWFGHVARHNDSFSLANNIMHGRGPGKRVRGRPRVSWIQIIRDYTGLSAIEAVMAAQDRIDWKKE